MDLSVDIDALEGRWLQRFNEFQDFRSRRTARKRVARDELEAAHKEIDVELSVIQNDRNQRIEVIQGEANAKIRRIEEQTKVEIQRLRDEANRKTIEIQEGTKKDVESLQENSERRTQELEEKRIAKKRKREDDDQEIESEYLTRLRTLDKRCMPPALPETPPPSATREAPTNPLPVTGHSTGRQLLTDAESHGENQENPRSTFTCLPPLRSTEHELAPQIARRSDASAEAGRKRRFEGFAKDGCVTCRSRIWRCDGARPICGKCKTDGQPCVWPRSKTPQQSVSHTARDDTSATIVGVGIEVPPATSSRPSNIDSPVRIRPDLSPAFAYDARRRPSQRLVRLNHSADRAEPRELNAATASGLSRPISPNNTQEPGDSSVNQSLPPLPGASSLPPRGQTERNAQQSSSLTAQRTITYDDVFQNVQREDSQEKHFIVEFPHESNKWYILRCDEHDKNFGEYPSVAARNHIDSEAHGHLERTQKNCISELGVLVLYCSPKRAERSNEAYRKVLQGGYRPKQGNMGRRQRRRSGTASIPTPGSIGTNPDSNDSRPAGLFKPFEGVVNPIPGEVYQGAQQKAGRMEPQWCLVVVLPLRNWKSIGISGSLHQSGLAKSMPPCYQHGSIDNAPPGASDWAEGFQKLGPRVKERSFPCLMLRPSLKIPLWDEEFKLPPDKWYFSWLDAGSLRYSWYDHLPTTLSRSTKGIDEGHEVARRFRQRLEAARAAHRGSQERSTVMSTPDSERGNHDQDGPNARGRNEVDRDSRRASEVDDHSTVVASESRSRNNSSRAAEGYVPINGSQQTKGNDTKELQEHENRKLVEETIVVSSSEYDEPESSLSSATSTVVSDPFDPNYSPKSPSSDDRNVSVDPAILDDDFDLGDYNSPSRPPSIISDIFDDAESHEGTQEAVCHSSCTGPGGSPSAVESLKAIQAELIPGYEDGDAGSEQSTGASTRSDLHLLFPGLSTRHTHEEHTAP